jgi:hypothetical protein
MVDMIMVHKTVNASLLRRLGEKDEGDEDSGAQIRRNLEL